MYVFSLVVSIYLFVTVVAFDYYLYPEKFLQSPVARLPVAELPVAEIPAVAEPPIAEIPVVAEPPIAEMPAVAEPPEAQPPRLVFRFLGFGFLLLGGIPFFAPFLALPMAQNVRIFPVPHPLLYLSSFIPDPLEQ